MLYRIERAWVHPHRQGQLQIQTANPTAQDSRSLPLLATTRRVILPTSHHVPMQMYQPRDCQLLNRSPRIRKKFRLYRQYPSRTTRQLVRSTSPFSPLAPLVFTTVPRRRQSTSLWLLSLPMPFPCSIFQQLQVIDRLRQAISLLTLINTTLTSSLHPYRDCNLCMNLRKPTWFRQLTERNVVIQIYACHQSTSCL